MFQQKLRDKIAEEIKAELCDCDCGDDHCFDSGIWAAYVIAKKEFKIPKNRKAQSS